ncbi:MAG: hypothetical protein KAH84_11055 [Thiomargarita sp.]|nr:hypothetical protein [Thiomargarita sp.]
MKKWFLSFLLCLSFSSNSSELYSPQTILHGDNQEITAKVKFASRETGDMYVATFLAGKLLFLTTEMNWVTTITPFLQNQTFEGEYPLFSVESGVLVGGNYPLYQIISKTNTDPLNPENWLGGEAGLNFLSFSLLPEDQGIRILPSSKGGMHCMDKRFDIFSILPPSNSLNVQVIRQDATPKFLNDSQIELRYTAVTDRRGSINSSSLNKTDFWQYGADLFAMDLLPGQGLAGLYMPADNTDVTTQSFQYKTEPSWFTAKSIPIVPIDDNGQYNSYPLLRVNAYDKNSGKLLAATDIVVPVSSDVSCKNCHATGETAANNPNITWATDTDAENEAKKNILILHDKHQGTDLQDNTPMLCNNCHYSSPLDIAKNGVTGMQKFYPSFSQAIHKKHGEVMENTSDENNCYQCHPGKTTRCHRGVMETVGIECKDCHGNLLAVGGAFALKTGGSLDGSNDGEIRRPWVDLPRCQSCHTGDATNYLQAEDLLNYDAIRLKQAYKIGDQSASPIIAENKRFAENDNTLFQDSFGHGGIACSNCHGSTHATWPNANEMANDNLTALQLQGHSGTIIECSTCHLADNLPLTINGPHGLHNINDERWTTGHEDFYENNASNCQACHGQELEGTALSKMAVTRSFNIEGSVITLEKGQTVSCDLCHNKP